MAVYFAAVVVPLFSRERVCNENVGRSPLIQSVCGGLLANGEGRSLSKTEAITSFVGQDILH